MPVGPLYRALQGALRAATPLVPGDGKVARALAGRRHADRRLVAAAETAESAREAEREGSSREGRTGERLVAAWLHAPSVGEALQARAVIEAWRALQPDLHAIFTHFSPSAENLAGRMPVQAADYLPWDLPGPMGRVLDAWRPGAVVFTKTEVWPVLVEAAHDREIPAALVAATLPPGAGRSGPMARWFLRGTWAALDLVGAVADADAERFVALGVRPDAITVTGDPGIDSAAARVASADPAARHLAPFADHSRPTVVAGSTWPSDDAVLVPALDRIRKQVPDVRVVMAPHEPTAHGLRTVEEALTARGWRVRRLEEVEAGTENGEGREREGIDTREMANVDAVLVDRVGVLSDLYTVGHAAYVGGGFHGAGLHSVVEPAAAGLPVAFGPGHLNARDAAGLEAAGGGAEVRDADALAREIAGWLLDIEGSEGRAALGYIASHRGAAGRTAALLESSNPAQP